MSLNCKYGVVGGAGAFGANDVFQKMLELLKPARRGQPATVVLEQHRFVDSEVAGALNANLTPRKLYVFDAIERLNAQGVEVALLPCFISHTFLTEVQTEFDLRIVSMIDALVSHLSNFSNMSGEAHPGNSVGILTSDVVRESGIFDEAFSRHGFKVRYPDFDAQVSLMLAIYGECGIKSGAQRGCALEFLKFACDSLIEDGASVIVPGFTEIGLVTDQLKGMHFPILDTNSIYASYAARSRKESRRRPLTVGVVGGVGPAATVDFLDKIVRNTPAAADQDHIKVVVDQNPQIPDRTANLIADGPDPTIALYATCKRLEAHGANLIAIPCNTAHAFTERIQTSLRVPIVNMLAQTIRHILLEKGPEVTVGLLATDGTLASGVYTQLPEAAKLNWVYPDTDYQALVMESIYGKSGVKAGFTSGQCKEDLIAAIAHLHSKGASVIILGCTELPVLFSDQDVRDLESNGLRILDPTEILAKRCVELVRAANLRMEGPCIRGVRRS